MNTHTHTPSVHTERGRPSTPRRVPVSCVVKIYMTRWQTDSGGAAILPISLLMLTALLLWLCICIRICACPHSDKCDWIKENVSELRLWVNSWLNALFELFFPVFVLLCKLDSFSKNFYTLIRRCFALLPYLTFTVALVPLPLNVGPALPTHRKTESTWYFGAGALIIYPAGSTGLAASSSPSIFTPPLFSFN